MPKHLLLLITALFMTGSACAGTIYDLGADTPPVLPTVVDGSAYITNTGGGEGGAGTGTGTVEGSLSVDQGAVLHLGYGTAAVATGDVGVTVENGMVVSGTVHMGKPSTLGIAGRPEAATSTNLSLDIAESLTIQGGAMEIYAASSASGATVTVGQDVVVNNGTLGMYGSASGEGGGGEGEPAAGSGTASLSARSVSVSEGEIYIGPFSSISTTLDSDPAAAAPEYAVNIGQGGRIVLNSGLPAAAEPPTDPEAPAPEPTAGTAGLDVSAGSAGIRVGAYGILSTGTSGGIIAGMASATDPGGEPPTEPVAAGQRLVVEQHGTLDVSRGSLSVTGMDQVQIAGTYMAGYNTATNTINKLDSASAAVVVEQTGTIAMSKQLQRALNQMEYHTQADSTILSGSSIAFVNGLPLVRSAMGDYHLDLAAGETDGMDLWVRRVENAVTGLGDSADRGLFGKNMRQLWGNKFLDSSFTNAVYSVAASETPVATSGAAGQLTSEVFDAFIAGPGAPVGTRGSADNGLLEFYIGGSQYGPSNIAFTTASELSHAVYNRINQVTTETYRFGSIGSSNAYAFYDPGEVYSRRFWAGGFGREEEADLDYGIAGYKYKPSGAIIGYDALCGPFILGGALSYGKGNYTDKAAENNDSKITSYSAGLYGGVHYQNGLIATAHASYTYMDNDMSDMRGGMERTAEYHADVWSLGARVAYETRPAERLTITPSIGLTRTEVHSQAHNERLDNISVLHVNKLRRRSTLLPLDVGVWYDVFCSGASMFRLGANFGYAYEFDNDGLTGDLEYYGMPGVAPVSVATREPGRNRFNFGAGFMYSGSKIDLTGKYDYYRRTGQHAHQFKGALGVKF